MCFGVWVYICMWICAYFMTDTRRLVAVCCSVLQRHMTTPHMPRRLCCSVLQCVAVCCSWLQCVAVSCSELQWVAVSCSVLQRHTTTPLMPHRLYCSVLLQCVALRGRERHMTTPCHTACVAVCCTAWQRETRDDPLPFHSTRYCAPIFKSWHTHKFFFLSFFFATTWTLRKALKNTYAWFLVNMSCWRRPNNIWVTSRDTPRVKKKEILQ